MKIEWTKIAKGESRGKEKAKISSLPEPSRLLSSEKIAKGESRVGEKAKISSLPEPSRLLSSIKIAKGMVSSRRETLQTTRGRKHSAPCRGLRDTLKIQCVDLSNDLVQVAFDSDALLLNFVEGIDFA